MSAELRLTASQFAELNNHLLSDEFEHAAILICETSRSRSGFASLPGGTPRNGRGARIRLQLYPS